MFWRKQQFNFLRMEFGNASMVGAIEGGTREIGECVSPGDGGTGREREISKPKQRAVKAREIFMTLFMNKLNGFW
jgi:hypothetical protein